MLLWLLQQALYGTGFFVVFVLAAFVYRHFKSQSIIKFYSDQGAVAIPGHQKFILGNIGMVIEYTQEKEQLKSKGGDPLPMPMLYVLDQSNEEKRFDYIDKHLIQVVNVAAPEVYVSDPKVVQDMVVTKNAQIDKTGVFEGIFKNFFGSSFLFSKSDDVWKAKRKGVAHAFYKDKLLVMLD